MTKGKKQGYGTKQSQEFYADRARKFALLEKQLKQLKARAFLQMQNGFEEDLAIFMINLEACIDDTHNQTNLGE